MKPEPSGRKAVLRGDMTNGLGSEAMSAPFLAQLWPCGRHQPLTALGEPYCDPADSSSCLGVCEEGFLPNFLTSALPE